jgi:SAM-dependent methyltransferase
MKHDLAFSKGLPTDGTSLLSHMGFSTSTDLFRALEEEIAPNPKVLCSLYSYDDGPEYPAPLSRALVVTGVADGTVSLVRNIVSNDSLPDCLHKCTVAVKNADARHMQRLDPQGIKNSNDFAKFIKQLKREEAVAIVSKDKHGRFGILAPMPSDSNNEYGGADDGDGDYIAEDFAAVCYVGDVREVMEFLTQRASSTTPASSTDDNNNSFSNGTMWQPPTADDSAGSAPWETGGGSESAAPWETGNHTSTAPWEVNTTDGGTGKRSFDDMNANNGDHDDGGGGDRFHADEGAAAADAFYSGLTRSLTTRADSRLYHMRAFNGWVKATQIQELDPRIVKNGRVQPKAPLRVLDLACGKGGDLTKWTLHERGISNYVGIDVARGSLRDAAERARELRKRNKLNKAIFTVADLGADVPGRKKSPWHKYMQKLSSWSLQDEPEYESGVPEFKMVRGGGILETDRFDIVSIQFAIHYMMSSRKRARRFFHTVSELLEVGGNLVCTTIDAREVVNRMIDLGHNFHFDGGSVKELPEQVVVTAGAGACKLRFEPEMVKRLFTSGSDGINAEDDLFGLQYAFTLVEGSDHAAGVGDAVNLPEWLTPIPVLSSLAKEAGMELDYGQNFHEFYETRKDSSAYPSAHHALYNMKVLNRLGSISADEWDVSRMYAAIKFRKVRESSIQLSEEDEDEEEGEAAGKAADASSSSDDESIEKPPVELDPIKAKKMLPMAMMKAKRSVGEEVWKNLSSDEKKRLTQLELEKIAAK